MSTRRGAGRNTGDEVYPEILFSCNGQNGLLRRDLFSISGDPSLIHGTPAIRIWACEKCVLFRSRMLERVGGDGPCSCLERENPSRQVYELDLQKLCNGVESGFQGYRNAIAGQLEANKSLLVDYYLKFLLSPEHRSSLRWEDSFIEVSIKIAVKYFEEEGYDGEIKVEKVQCVKRSPRSAYEKGIRTFCQTIGFAIKFEVVYLANHTVYFGLHMELPLTREEVLSLNEYLAQMLQLSQPYSRWRDHISHALSDPDYR